MLFKVWNTIFTNKPNLSTWGVSTLKVLGLEVLASVSSFAPHTNIFEISVVSVVTTFSNFKEAGALQEILKLDIFEPYCESEMSFFSAYFSQMKEKFKSVPRRY